MRFRNMVVTKWFVIVLLLAMPLTSAFGRARLEIQDGRLSIHVDRANGASPITNSFVQRAELTASDAAQGWEVGTSVAISGNTIAVGACSGGDDFQGTAYVFVKPASGWQNTTQTAELTASDAAPEDGFGCSIAISGNTVVIGASQANVGQNQRQGAAYIYVEPAGGWTNMTETAKLTSSDGGASDGLGFSRAIFGDVVALGALGQLGGEGAAYVYTRPATGWQTTSTFKAKLTGSDLTNNLAALGWSVATDGATVVAGAPNRTDPFGDFLGAAYLFVAPAGGWTNMTQTARLTSSFSTGKQFVGSSVAISGGTVAAGARQHNESGNAYIFVEPPGGWVNMTQTAVLTSSDRSTSLFGASITMNSAGTTIAVGAPQTNNDRGAVDVFVKPASGWVNMTQSFELSGSDDKIGSEFGSSVSISGNTVVAGAPLALNRTGAAYVF